MSYVPSLFLEFQFDLGKTLTAHTFISKPFYKNIHDPETATFQ